MYCLCSGFGMELGILTRTLWNNSIIYVVRVLQLNSMQSNCVAGNICIFKTWMINIPVMHCFSQHKLVIFMGNYWEWNSLKILWGSTQHMNLSKKVRNKWSHQVKTTIIYPSIKDQGLSYYITLKSFLNSTLGPGREFKGAECTFWMWEPQLCFPDTHHPPSTSRSGPFTPTKNVHLKQSLRTWSASPAFLFLEHLRKHLLGIMWQFNEKERKCQRGDTY